MIKKLLITTLLNSVTTCFTTTKNNVTCLLLLLLVANNIYSQSLPETDPLYGFDEAAVLQEFRQREGSEIQHPEIYQQFLDFKKQEYIGIKNGTWGQTTEPTTLSTRSGECGNLDFETGDFSEWSGKRGNNPGCCNTNGFGTVGVNAAVNDANAQHTIVTGTGNDPCGGFPVNAPALPGQVQGTYSCRLGNSATGGKAEQLEIQFTPSATNNIFTYQYAVVLQNAGHGQNDQPFFRVQMFDANNNPIPCTAVTYIAQFGQTADDFQPSPNCNGVSFLPWSTVSVDLTAYLNTTVTIRFTTADCTAGGHYGYGYVNTECTQIVVTQQDSLCMGGSVILNAPVEADNTYNWTGPGGPYTGQSISVSQPGTYNVTMTSATGCVKALSYTVIQYPTAILDPLSDLTICNGQDATLVATIGGAATSGTWMGGSGTFNPNNTSTTCTYTPSAAEIAAGTATLIFTTNNPEGPCPAVSDTLVITINPKATVSASTDQIICAGDMVTLAGSFGGAATTATWSGGAGTFTPNTTTATATYMHTFAEAGAGSATLIFTTDDPVGPCPAVSDTMIVTINTPAFINPAPDKTICSNQSATLAVSLGGSATGGTWSGGNGSFDPDNTSINCTYTPSAAEKTAGTATLIFTTNDPTGPCPAVSDTIVITINPEATVSAGLDQTICIGNPAVLNGSFGGGASSGFWTGGAGNYTPNDTTATAIYEPSTSENTSSSATLIFTTNDPVGPCPAISDTMSITINQLPTANAGSTQYVCRGSSITLAGSIGGTATSGTWSGGAGTFYPNNTTLDAIYTPTDAEYAADSVLLTLTTDDPVGPCTFSSSNVTFRFYQNPNVNFIADDPNGCPTHCVNFTDQSTVGGAGANLASWSWDFGDGSSASTDANPYHCFELTGLYDIKLIVTSNQGCTSSLSIPQMIEVYALPIAEFTPTPSYATVIEPVITMLNQSSPDVNYWNWDLGDGTLLNPGTANPTHAYPNQSYGDYTVTLIVSNANDCYDTVAHPVSIGPEFTFFIPNAFSPNGDGKNDYFYGTGIGITKYDIWIFDRWGNMIFHGNDLGDQWDGKANDGDNAAQIDVYIWKVQLTDVFNKTHNYTGTVTLVR